MTRHILNIYDAWNEMTIHIVSSRRQSGCKPNDLMGAPLLLNHVKSSCNWSPRI